MPYKFRNPGPWGPGSTEDLDAIDIDNNFWQAILDIQAKAAQGVGIANMVVTGSLLTVVLTDHTLLGPYQLPIVQFIFKGEWLPNYAYLGGSIITHGGSTYFIPVNHTSEATFDPGANDGHGQNFYELLLQSAIQRLDDLQDVNIISPQQDAPLTYDSGAWIAGTPIIRYLAKLLDVRSSPSPSTGDLVYWDGIMFSYIAPSDLVLPPTNTLGSLTDVSLVSSKNDQVLTYDVGSSKWKNKSKQLFQQTSGLKTLTLTDGTSFLSSIGTGGMALTIPSASAIALPENTQAWCRQSSNGPVQVIPDTGVTISVPPGRKAQSRAVGSVIGVRSVAAASNLWQIDGDLAFDSVALPATDTDLASLVISNDTDLFLGTPTGNVTYSMSTVQVGKKMTMVFVTSGTTSYNISFSSGFKANGIIVTAPVSGAVHTISFVGDGTNMIEVCRSPVAATASEPVFIDIGNKSGSFALDLTTSTRFTMTGNSTITGFTWPSATGQLLRRVIEVINSGSFTLGWPFASKWPGGTKPTQTFNGFDTYILFTSDSGTTVYGNIVGQNYS